MTVRVRKNKARQGERRTDQERVFARSIVIAVISLGAITAAWILIRPFAG
ncbi:MAG: hypothetical protein ACLFQ5_09680 [Oceanicaulis sp.]